MAESQWASCVLIMPIDVTPSGVTLTKKASENKDLTGILWGFKELCVE